MTYNIAVWEGDRPATHAAGDEAFWRLLDRLQGSKEPPSERICAYVDSLLSRWPDITDERGDDSPWADGPLINNASGNAIYFSMVFSMAEEASAFAAQLAERHGLVCYDPQEGILRPLDSASSYQIGNSAPHGRRRSWLDRFRRL